MNKRQLYILTAVGMAAVIALLFLIHGISEYGPTSNRAKIRACTLYVMESYGGINSGSGVWSTYKENEADLQMDFSAKEFCDRLGIANYTDEESARELLLSSVKFKVEEVVIDGNYASVTVKYTPKKSVEEDLMVLLFEKKYGAWQMDSDSFELLIYFANNVGSSNRVENIYDALGS